MTGRWRIAQIQPGDGRIGFALLCRERPPVGCPCWVELAGDGRLWLWEPGSSIPLELPFETNLGDLQLLAGILLRVQERMEAAA